MSETYLGSHEKGEIEIEKEVPVFENKFMTLFNDDVIFPGGGKGQYLRTVWRAPYGVMVMPITDVGKIVLVRNFRHQSRSWGWELVKGFGIEGISKEECANKELEEETGLRAKMIKEVKRFPDQGIVTTLFCAKGLESGVQNREVAEAISEVRAFSKEEVYALINSDECHDPFTLFGLLLFTTFND